jgi:hypothetical protein
MTESDDWSTTVGVAPAGVGTRVSAHLGSETRVQGQLDVRVRREVVADGLVVDE